MNITLDIDTPRDPEYTLEVAEAAAECIRVLNHATLMTGSGALRYPPHLDRLVRELSTLALRLPQLCGQLKAWLAAEREAARIEMHGGDYDGRPDLAAAAVASRLEEAQMLASQLQDALEAAAHITADMAVPCGEGGGDDA